MARARILRARDPFRRRRVAIESACSVTATVGGHVMDACSQVTRQVTAHVLVQAKDLLPEIAQGGDVAVGQRIHEDQQILWQRVTVGGQFEQVTLLGDRVDDRRRQRAIKQGGIHPDERRRKGREAAMLGNPGQEGLDLRPLGPQRGDPLIDGAQDGVEVLENHGAVVVTVGRPEHVRHLGQRNAGLDQPSDPHQPGQMCESVGTPCRPRLGDGQQPQLVVVPDRPHRGVGQFREVLHAHTDHRRV